MLNVLRSWFIRSFTKVVRQYWVNGKCSYSILAGGTNFYIREGKNGLILFNKPFKTLDAAIKGVSDLAEFRYGTNPHYTLQDGLPLANK